MKNLLWFFVMSLVAVNISMLVHGRQLTQKLKTVRTQAEVALLKSRYANEEEALLIGKGKVPTTFPYLRVDLTSGDAVQFFLLASVDDCTNSIEDEVVQLNKIALMDSVRVAGVQGFFVDEARREVADRFIKHLSPAPRFPVSVKNAISELPEATTPLVLVIRSRDGKILDAHKPIPQDLTKRDAFYARWSATLGLI